MARKKKHTNWEDDYVKRLERMDELMKERVAFLASFTFPGYEDTNASSGGGTGGDGAAAGMTSGNTTEEKIWNFFAGKGFTAAAAAGVMGNLMQESTLRVDAVGPETKYGKAWGIGQWLGGRLNNLKSQASQKKVAETDLAFQLEFIWWELNGGDPTTKSKLDKLYGGIEKFKSSADYKFVVKAYEDSFERSGGSAMTKRENYAKGFLDKYGGGNGASSAGVVGGAKGDAKKIIEYGKTWLSKPNKYVFGGGRTQADIDAGRFDCSSWVRYVFSQSGYNIMGTSGLSGNTDVVIGNKNLKTITTSELKEGDLVFFDTYKQYGHITIYIGNNQCIGSQSDHGVAILDMNNNYWKPIISATHRRVL